jgi:hypothetical protein
MKIKVYGLFIAFGMIVMSCNKDDKVVSNNEITKDQVTIESKIDASIEDINDIIDNEFIFRSNINGKLNTVQTFLPDCVVVTSQLDGNMWTTTVDFGTNGCSLSNDNILKGKIIVSFTNDFQADTKIISYTFENFSHDDISINGNRTLTRTKQNANGHPESKFEFDMTLTFPNGETYSRNGLRIREWIAGFDTLNIKDDDIHLITGNWSTTNRNNETMSMTITEPLKKLGNCNFIVEGVIKYTRGTSEAILDFGDGDCDNQATLTIDGNTTTIIL